MVKDNNLLGTFDLTGIPPAPRGVPQIEVSFDLDSNGILTVTAKDKSTSNEKKIEIKNDSGRLSSEDIDRLVKEAEEFAEQDKMNRERIDAKNALENLVYSSRNSANEHADKLGEANKDKILTLCNNEIEWLDSHPSEDKEVYAKHSEEFSREVQGLFGSMGGGVNGDTAPNNDGPVVEEMD